MRTHSTRANPRSISRAARNGNAAFDKSADVSDCSTSRDSGPCTLSCANAAVTSVTNACASPTSRRSCDSTWRWAVSVATTMNESSSSLVTVRSASSSAALVEPLGVRDLPGVAVDGVGGHAVEHASRVATLDPELRHEAHVHHDHVLAAGSVLGVPSRPERGATPRERAGVGRRARSRRTNRRPPNR